MITFAASKVPKAALTVATHRIRFHSIRRRPGCSTKLPFLAGGPSCRIVACYAPVGHCHGPTIRLECDAQEFVDGGSGCDDNTLPHKNGFCSNTKRKYCHTFLMTQLQKKTLPHTNWVFAQNKKRKYCHTFMTTQLR